MEPAIIQSAFHLHNGIKFIVYTGILGIKTFLCDENWNHGEKPYASEPADFIDVSYTDYHKKIRKMHGEKALVEKYSTKIDWE